MQVDLTNILNVLKNELDPFRYEHSIGVSYTATALAYRYAPDLAEKARIAGLLHDCSKKHNDNEFIALCEQNNISISEYEAKNPGLLHAKYSAYLAENVFNIKDNDILNSIIYHTTGKPGMNMLEKIIYIADYIEPNRTKQKRLFEIRTKAFENIDEALLMILTDTVEHLNTKNQVIDITTENTYNYYKGIN